MNTTYFVNEIQNNTSMTYSFATLAEAQAKYHYILSFAAVSDVERHGAIMYDSNGTYLMGQVYEHPAQA